MVFKRQHKKQFKKRRAEHDAHQLAKCHRALPKPPAQYQQDADRPQKVDDSPRSADCPDDSHLLVVVLLVVLVILDILAHLAFVKLDMLSGRFDDMLDIALAEGFHVIMADKQDCSEHLTALKEKHYSVSALELDLAQSSSFAAIAAAIENDFGKLDVLVNNAAILIDMGNHPSDLSEELLRLVIEVNHIGPFLFTKALTPLLKKAEAARIVNVSSQVAQCILQKEIPSGVIKVLQHIDFCELQSVHKRPGGWPPVLPPLFSSMRKSSQSTS